MAVFNPAADIKVAKLVPDDTGVLTATHDQVILQGDVEIQGNAQIKGDLTSINTQNLTVADQYINVNFPSYNTSSEGGMVIGTALSTTTYTLSGSFTAGAGAASPTVGTVEASGLSAGALVQIAGSTSNDGIYQVLSHTGNVLTVAGAGPTPTSDAFTMTNFKAEAATGNVRGCTICVLRATGTGFTVGSGSTAGFTYQQTSGPWVYSTDMTTAHLANDLTLDGTTKRLDVTNLVNVSGSALILNLDAIATADSIIGAFSAGPAGSIPASIQSTPYSATTAGAVAHTCSVYAQKIGAIWNVVIDDPSSTNTGSADYITLSLPTGTAPSSDRRDYTSVLYNGVDQRVSVVWGSNGTVTISRMVGDTLTTFESGVSIALQQISGMYV